MTTPKSIGRYEIVSEIGRGAMGIVYLAHDPRIDRRVAIKTIHALDVLPSAEAEEIRMRFTREAQAAGRLQHPGIVTIFDVGEQDGTCFIAMEYIEGDTLERYTGKRALLPAERAVELIVQACEALDYAHQHHIVHRDIKPANLMLLRSGKLKITDFGLAKNPRTSLTQEGVLIGTPNYMSPEQVMGRPLDGRSDLFSLAAVLYELLTGERSFPGDTVTTIIYRILNEQPSPPHMVRKEIPPMIGPVLNKALAKEPERRYQTGAELASALEGRAVLVAAQGVGATRPMMVTQHSSASARSSVSQTADRTATNARPELDKMPAPASRHARLRTGVIMAGTLAMVLLLPGASTIDDRWGLGPSGAGGVGGAAPGRPGGRPLEASLAPPVTLPGGAESIAVTWRTSPPGGRIYVDDVEAPGGVVHLPKSDTAAHSVVAENDCFIENVTWRAGQDSDGAARTIELKTPKVAKVPISSSPAGAKILLDGRDTGQVTPSELPLPVCQRRTLGFRLEGYKEVDKPVEKPGEAVNMTLVRLPVGFVKISAPYPVTIYENGKPLGQSGAPIKLAGGAHRLVLKNEDLFVERPLSVTVRADQTVSPAAGLPGVGTLTVLASPSNCSISVNGRDLGPPPINDYQLAAGAYTVRAVYVPTGESKEMSVTITAGGGTRVPFKFSP